MHTPTQFVESRPEVLRTFIHEHPFATIVAAAGHDLEAEHVPVLFEVTPGPAGVLRGHVAGANPIWKKLTDGTNVLCIFQGPNHYISPSWYPSKKVHGKVVPTWNYIVVHVRGHLTWQHDRYWLRTLLDRTTAAFERNQKLPWHVSDAPSDYVERMLGSIVGFEISIGSIVGKWKLSQNRSAEDYAGVRDGLASEGASGAAEIGEWMRESKRS